MGFFSKRRAPEGSEADLSTAQGKNNLVFYLVSRFIVVLLAVIAAESLLVLLENVILVPMLQGMVSGQDAAGSQGTTSVFALMRWLFLMITSLAQGNYVQMVGLASRSLAVVLAVLMLVLLAVPVLVGAVVFARTIVRKVGALQQQREQELAAIDRQRSRFMADVAHDLRTPVMAISGMAHAMRDGLVPEGPMRDEYVQAICDKSDKLGQLVTSVFDYTKLGSEGFALQRENVDLPQLLLAEAAAAYTDIEDAGMTFSVEVPEDTCIVSADPAQLRRVVANLLVNAARHNPPGTEVALILAYGSGAAFVMVADSGVPITDDPESLFQPFTQGDASRSKPGGSGLGLSICKRIADLHGFDLGISQPYGRFTKAFVLQCPIG